MAVASVVLYQGEGGWSVEDVNRLSDSFSKMRQWRSHDGVDLTDLFVITESDPSLFYRQVKVHKQELKYEGFWNNIHCLEYAARELHSEDKAIFLPHPTIALDLVGIPILENVPEQGKTENAAKSISEEDKALVRENMLFPVQQFDNWWNDETDMSPFWLGIPSSTCRYFFNSFNNNYDSILEDYDPNAYGWQQYIECELEPNLFYLNHPHGINAPYKLHEKEGNKARNEIWESNVRPYFQNEDDGYGWRGLGGEPDALLYDYDHEYRTVSRQVSFITFEGETDRILEDEWVRWFIL